MTVIYQEVAMSERDAMRLALHAMVSLRTVYRWLAEPGRMHATTRLRIETSARELGLVGQRMAA